MGLDYYAILDVRREANRIDVVLAYRKLAIRTHPIRQETTCKEAVELPLPTMGGKLFWRLLNEAFDVLSDPLRRQVFDLYGEEGLKKGVTSPGGYIEPYIYHEKCDETYASVMGSYSPYADLIDAVTHPPPLLATCGRRCAKVKDPSIERLLYLDLIEVFNGGTKKLKVERLELVDDMQCKTELREKLLVINFPPGVLPGTRFVFPEEGDQGPTRIPADIVFIVVDRPHVVFRREQADLHMKCEVALKDALVGFGLTVFMIDGRKFNVPITTTPIAPGYVHTLVGEGLPLMGNQNERGSLYISFDIKFPKFIAKPQKLKIIEVFREIGNYEGPENPIQ